MRRTLPTLFALLMLATPLAGQGKPAHVYWVSYYQVLPGKQQAYTKAIAESTIPLYDELVKRKVVVSYLHLAQSAGSGEYTHLIIVEFANWAALDGLVAKGNDAAQAVLHKSYSEFLAGFVELRRLVRHEDYLASVQQP
jgi:hypothetical protein